MPYFNTTMMKFITKKRAIIAGIIILVAFVIFRNVNADKDAKEYETTAVVRGNLVQTVEATGKISADTDIDLRFEIPGVVSVVNVKEGAIVKKGTLLASLRLSELNAQVAQANASLQLKLAGLTPEDQQYYQSAVDAAQATYEESINSTKQSYDDLLAALQASVPKFDDALTQADNILGVDNTFANESFRLQLSGRDRTKLGTATTYYSIAKKALQEYRAKVITLQSSDLSGLKQGAQLASAVSNEMQILLMAVSDVLRYTAPQGDLTQAGLDAKKTVIETTRTSLASAQTTLTNTVQAIGTAETNERSKQAALTQAQANFESKNSTPRAVDVAGLRAALSQAVAMREKAMLRAPIDGVISKVTKQPGETVSGAETMIKLLSPHYEVTVDVPETDVPKLKLNDQAIITLDALGNDVRLSGIVTSIEPSSTEIQDVVYYKVTIALPENNTTIKPGMTANIVIATASREGVLYIPTRTVRSDEEGTKYVRVLENGIEKEVVVKLGLKANDGKIEVLEGLTEGQNVIVSVKEKK